MGENIPSHGQALGRCFWTSEGGVEAKGEVGASELSGGAEEKPLAFVAQKKSDLLRDGSRRKRKEEPDGRARSSV